MLDHLYSIIERSNPLAKQAEKREENYFSFQDVTDDISEI